MITEHPVVCGSGVFLLILARPDLGITIETDEPPGREKCKTAGLFPENSAAEKHGQVLVNSVEKWYNKNKNISKMSDYRQPCVILRTKRHAALRRITVHPPGFRRERFACE